jgi:hypothetical protein
VSKKTWVNVISSFVLGLIATWGTSLINIPSDCLDNELAGACFREKGFPLTYLSGIGYGGTPWHVDWYSLVLNTLIWTLIALIVFAIIIPFLRDNVFKKGDK